VRQLGLMLTFLLSVPASAEQVSIAPASSICREAAEHFAKSHDAITEVIGMECVVAPCPSGVMVKSSNYRIISNKLKSFLESKPETRQCLSYLSVDHRH
jgi:hypothetical protein